MNWGTNRYIPTQEDILRIQQLRRDNQVMINTLYKLDYSTDVEELWKKLADKCGVKLPRHNHPKASKLSKFANSIGLNESDWKEGLFGSYYKLSLQKAIDLHNNKLPEGQKESLRTRCGYILEGNCKP